MLNELINFWNRTKLKLIWAVLLIFLFLELLTSDEIVSLVLATAITYRFSHMIVGENGPFNIFLHFRTILFSTRLADTWIGDGFNCVLCVSFWFSFLVGYLIVDRPVDVFDYFIFSMAVSGLCLVVHRSLYRD